MREYSNEEDLMRDLGLINDDNKTNKNTSN